MRPPHNIGNTGPQGGDEVAGIMEAARTWARTSATRTKTKAFLLARDGESDAERNRSQRRICGRLWNDCGRLRSVGADYGQAGQWLGSRTGQDVSVSCSEQKGK